MNKELLKHLGLTESQAKTYLALVKSGRLNPQQLALKTKEKRTASYMALSKLEELGLARVAEGTRPKSYEPASPSQLSRVLEKRKQDLEKTEKDFRDNLPDMLNEYFEAQNRPGVRFYAGREGIQEIYKDHLQVGGEVLVVRTTADEEFGNILYDYMEARAEHGIKSEILGPALAGPMQWASDNNERLKRINYWVPPEYYTAPVEVSIYKDRLSLISFGKETIGVIIESPQIAESMRQLWRVAKIGAGTLMERRKSTDT